MMEAACPWAPTGATTGARVPAPPPEPSRPYDGPSVLEEWDRRVPASVVLERNGYEPAGSGRWLAPDSKRRAVGIASLRERNKFFLEVGL